MSIEPTRDEIWNALKADMLELLGEPPRQLTAADADRMTPEQIVAAKARGQFDDLLRGGAS